MPFFSEKEQDGFFVEFREKVFPQQIGVANLFIHFFLVYVFNKLIIKTLQDEIPFDFCKQMDLFFCKISQKMAFILRGLSFLKKRFIFTPFSIIIFKSKCKT